MAVIVSALRDTAATLSKKVVLFTTRSAAATAEAKANEETFARGASVFEGDEALTEMFKEGFDSTQRALKLKTAKLETSLKEAKDSLAAVEAEIAAKTAVL